LRALDVQLSTEATLPAPPLPSTGDVRAAKDCFVMKKIHSAAWVATTAISGSLPGVSAHAQSDRAIPPYSKPNNPGPEPFIKRVITDGLAGPWEVTFGPDGYLWITERTGKRVVRVDPVDGTRKVALTIDEVYTDASQDGLLGMALHPDLLRGRRRDYVYVAFSYDADPSEATARRMKLRRYTYDVQTETLDRPIDLIDSLQASNDHNSGRLKIGPDRKLYYTIGEQGKNQGVNFCLENQAQRLPTQAEIDAGDWWAYQGKVLRLNLDGSIPRNNPVIEGVRSHVYSYGHRNVQGIAFGPDGTLYGAEHGPKSDDEINILMAGHDYGWPYVAGYLDDSAYRYFRWFESSPAPCTTLVFSNYVVPDDVPSTEESEWGQDFTPPMLTFYTVPDDHDFLTGPGCDGTSSCSPTVAPSSIEVYTQQSIPGWADSLLITTLKEGALFRVKLKAPGVPAARAEDALEYFDSFNRYRDVALSPDGTTIYIVTDPDGVTVGPTAGYITELENRGAVLEFKYQGPPRPHHPLHPHH
jgi:PQQ-dependent dehydrogenase (s-GDH family)